VTESGGQKPSNPTELRILAWIVSADFPANSGFVTPSEKFSRSLRNRSDAFRSAVFVAGNPLLDFVIPGGSSDERVFGFHTFNPAL
jgi:hypothetical protein|tara:strand:- start:11764 stop:12021 length:258 start_codon:yes stop_codon:yes gene_type:complete